MNTLVSLLALAIVMLAKPSLVNTMPVQSVDSCNDFKSSVDVMLCQLTGATQEIQGLLTQHGTVRSFEYCFLPKIANPPSTNLTIEDRLLIDYQVLNELTTPLRDVVNYEGRIRNNNTNDLNLYQKAAWAWEQLNTSLEELQKIQNNPPQLMQQLSHLDLLSEENHQFNSTSNNTTTTSHDRCKDVITNSTDVFHDLFEINLGLHFALSDLLDILH